MAPSTDGKLTLHQEKVGLKQKMLPPRGYQPVATLLNPVYGSVHSVGCGLVLQSNRQSPTWAGKQGTLHRSPVTAFLQGLSDDLPHHRRHHR